MWFKSDFGFTIDHDRSNKIKDQEKVSIDSGQLVDKKTTVDQKSP